MKNGIKLLNNDCIEVMKTYPDNYFDLAIVDPPYGIGEDGRKNHTRTKLAKAKDYSSNARYDNAIPSKEYFTELFRVSKDQIIFGGNYFIDHLKNTSSFIIWDKDNGDSDFADCELAWTSHNKAVRKAKYRWAGMLQGDMKNKEERFHPNQKPINLYNWILTNYAKTDFKILDTHLGSGSSVIAAYHFGISEFVGIEIDETYYNRACKRFEQLKSQQVLFSQAS